MLLAAILIAAQDYETRLRELHDAIGAERQKTAEALEKMKAFAWARAEYRKILRLDPTDEGARRKLEGAGALPLANEGMTASTAARYAEFLDAVGKAASTGHASLARWCAEQKKEAAARRHWELALLFDPAHADAIAALGLDGTGAAAVDPLWKGQRWKELASKADAGKESSDESAIEKKWRVKTAKRQSATFAWEGVDAGPEHLKTLARRAEGAVAFLRLLLGDEKAAPCVKKIIIMTGKEPYHRYIDDFVEAPPETIKLLKKTGGMQNIPREEFAQFAWERGADWHDSVVVHSVAEFMLAPALGLKDYDAPPAWLKEGVGCFSEILFRAKVKASCVQVPTGTGAGDVPWDNSTNWDSNLKGLVARGRDPELSEVISVTLNAMKGEHRAKAASVVRFLAMRWPAWFREVVAAYAKGPKEPKAALESALALSLDELDEAWRRWLGGK